jgi:hypothetical protein
VAATLTSIELALYTALSGLLTNVTTGPTTARPFACVARYAGQVPQEGLAEAAAAWPCALLRFDDDISTRDVHGFGVESIEDRALASFSVLVGVEDPRDIADGMIGDANVPGLLRLVDAVIAACNGVTFADPHMQMSIRYAGTRAELVKRGTVYVYAVRFDATRDAAAVAFDASGATLIPSVNSDINITGTGTPAPNPLVQIVSEPNP